VTDAPDFSGFATAYAASRPRYPRELFVWLASVSARGGDAPVEVRFRLYIRASRILEP
jgi:hypothetical protein